MSLRMVSIAFGVAAVVAATALGQGSSSGTTTTAQVETMPIELTQPERYQVPVVLVPGRRLWLIAPADGFLQGIASVGATVKKGAEIGQFDRAEAQARLRIAEANAKEMQAELDSAKAKAPAAQARLDAAKARVELAQIEHDRCMIRAPFAGRILDVAASPGQFVTKGTTVAELADVSELNVLVPVNRTAVAVGGNLELDVEGKAATGKVLSLLPLPEGYAVLRELATPWAGAWVSINNNSGALESGQRVRNPYVPAAPIATLPTRAVHGSGSSAKAQVIRGGVVEDIPVGVLGVVGPERTQVSGAFRPYDAVIVEAKPELVAGTSVFYATDASNPTMNITPPVGGSAHPSGGARVAPIGAPDSAVPKVDSRRPSPGGSTRTPAKGGSPKAGSGSKPGAVPF
jgi:hypothetical protein